MSPWLGLKHACHRLQGRLLLNQNLIIWEYNPEKGIDKRSAIINKANNNAEVDELELATGNSMIPIL